MIANLADFVSKRLQVLIAAFLCLSVLQLGVAVATAPKPQTAGAVRVSIEP
jgi:hypothetical protein